MQAYKNFDPTGIDGEGKFLTGYDDDHPDRQDWLVCPVTRTRDTPDNDLLAESNFSAMLDALGGEGENVEVYRFGHWGPGWFEIILVRPGTPEETTAREQEERLENYPVLDEDDFSRRELEQQIERIESILPPEDDRTSNFPDTATGDLWRHCWDNQGFDRGNYETLARDYMVSHGWVIPECRSVTYFPTGNTVCVRCHLVICRDYKPDEGIKAVLDHPEVYPAEHCQRCGRILADTFGDDLQNLPAETDTLISYGVV